MTRSIFMIHGMWCGPWVWDNYMDFFRGREFECRAPTLRYHDTDTKDGDGEKLGKVSLLDYAEDLEGELKTYKEPPVVIGHSMGGLLAQILAARGLAKAAVLLTPAAPNGVRSLTPSVVRCFLGVMGKSLRQKPMKLTYEKADYAMMEYLPEKQKKEIYAKLVHESGRAAREIGFRWMCAKWALASTVKSISCPLLVIAGKDDRITPASVVEKIAGKYEKQAKQLKYNVYEKHAHWIIGEPGWENIAGDVHDWLIDKL